MRYPHRAFLALDGDRTSASTRKYGMHTALMESLHESTSMKKAAVTPASNTDTKFSDLDALRDLYDLIEQRRVNDEHASQIPDQISIAQIELDSLGARIVDSELALLQVTDKKLPDAMKAREALEQQQVECELRIRRLRTKLSAIESRAPDLDEKIELATGVVRIEANMASEALQSQLAEEIREKTKDLQLLYAKVRALHRLVPMPRTDDFLLDAYIPDLEACMRINTGTSSYNTAPNLLVGTSPETQRAEAEIVALLKPISAAIAAGRQHRPYIPLAKRPQPYVRKGILLEAGAGVIGAQIALQR